MQEMFILRKLFNFFVVFENLVFQKMHIIKNLILKNCTKKDLKIFSLPKILNKNKNLED